jgi:hypothetical protein
MRSYLILGMCVIFLIQYFVDNQWLQYLVVIMSLIAFMGSTVKADPFPRWLGIMMMVIGIILEFQKGTGVEGISDGIFTILPLLCLITLAPLLSLPLKLGGYFEAVSSLLTNLLDQPKKLYAGITSTLFVLSPVLSLGSVRIIHEFLEDLKLPVSLSSKSYVVGFTTAVMWSPYFASVSLVLYYLDVPFNEYILYGLGLAILSLAIGYVTFAMWGQYDSFEKDTSKRVPFEKYHRQQLMKLALFVVGLMGICLIVEHITRWSMVVIVCMLSILIPILYGAITRRWKQIVPPLEDFRDRTVPMLNNEIMLFMSAGLLGFAMKGTSVANGISDFLTRLAQQSFFLFAIAVMAFVLLITFIGIHQIAAVGALAMQLNAEAIGISNISLALLLLLTWSTSTALSPFSGLNLMVGRFTGTSGVKTGFYANGVHLLLVAIIGIIIISFVA